MRIVITGASGNLGSALVRRLGGDGHDLVGISRRAPENTAANIEWVTADLTEDSAVPVLRDAFAGADAVVHLAWGFQPSHDLAYLEELGVGGTRRVLEAVDCCIGPAPGAHVVAGRLLTAAGRPPGRRVLGEGWRADVAVQPAQGGRRAAPRRP